MKSYEHIGVKIPKILLPSENVDFSTWAVVACDQYTSEPDYWQKVAELVGDEPSTLKLIFPEVYLKESDREERIQNINAEMKKYLESEVFEEKEGLIYVERTVEGTLSNEVAGAPKQKVLSETRQGIILALDLEKYDFNKGSKSLIRATEGTIVNRLPPRIEVRKDAPIELPHIMVLIDDPNKSVIEPIQELKNDLELVYDFELMMEGGFIKGYRINNESITEQVLNALENLSNKESYKEKYQTDDDNVLLFAMGDGNHSLATAKAIWEENKTKLGIDHPSRYALVEINNIHSEAIVFEPIHRLVFNTDVSILLEKMISELGAKINYSNSKEELIDCYEIEENKHKIGFVCKDKLGIITVENPESKIEYGTLQNFLNKYSEENKDCEIDYVHGEEIVFELGKKENNIGFFLPPIQKNNFFKTVIFDGSLPRKSFSMGHAHEKRFYLEGRRIQ